MDKSGYNKLTAADRLGRQQLKLFFAFLF